MGLQKVVPVEQIIESSMKQCLIGWMRERQWTVFLDFKKTFDKVPHRRLLTKVRTCGVTGQVANWIANWLSDRKQRVAVSGRI